LKWRFKTDEEVKSSPAIGEDGTIYVGSWDGFLYAIYPNSTLKWKFNTDDAIDASPTLAQDGTIYMGSYNGKIFSITSEGMENWRYKTDDWVISSAAIDKNGVIYIGSFDGYFYALNPNGTMRWKLFAGDYIESSPAIAEDGAIYFGCWDGHLYAINVIENEPPDQPNINGTTSGKIRIEYTYTAVTSDPDGDNVSFYFDWGDGTNSGWTEYVPSGIQVNETHKWSKGDTYEIKVKAQDVYGAESEWTTLEITMPKNQQSQNILLFRFLESYPRMFPILRQLKEL
jgi:outer membrane protein assembly factor BamB